MMLKVSDVALADAIVDHSVNLSEFEYLACAWRAVESEEVLSAETRRDFGACAKELEAAIDRCKTRAMRRRVGL